MRLQLVTLTGLTCSGKSTLERHLVDNHNFKAVMSTTTRAPRSDEIHGKHYNFISKEEFKAKLANDDFIEHVEFDSNFYGIAKSDLPESGRAVLVCEPNGAAQILNYFKDSDAVRVVPVFIVINAERAFLRLLKRSSMSDEAKAKRLVVIAKTELNWSHAVEYHCLTGTQPTDVLARSIVENFLNEN
jgi:guanylate kinase